MSNLNKKIVELYKKGKDLQDAAIGAPFEEAVEIRKIQKETFKKFNFMKGYKAASDKLKKEKTKGE
jgi:hypothetical protein